MKKLIDNKFANLYLNAALNHGLKYKIINHPTSLVKIYDDSKELRISGNVMDLNKEFNARLAANKKKTSVLLSKEKIPVPRFATFKSTQKAIRYAVEKIKNKKDIVIKPIFGEGAFGITICPASKDQIKTGIAEAFSKSKEIMIEEYINGENFRITIFDNEIIAVTKRIPGYVIANGVDTVAQLINKKNKLRAQKNLPPIVLRKKDLNFLCSRDINLTKKYQKGRKIILQKGCDLEIGGERARVPKTKIPNENKQMFKNAAYTIGLRLSGIDYITPDITKSYTSIKSAINEVNSVPSFDVHYLDSFPNDNYAAERLIEKFFAGNSSTDKFIQKTPSTTIFKDTITSSQIKSQDNTNLN